MSDARFQFGNVVVVNGEDIGVIVKTWETQGGYSHDVYVRYFNEIRNYMETDIKHFIYSKELTEDERAFYS